MEIDLDRLKANLKQVAFGEGSDQKVELGLCRECGEPALPKCYSEAGRREFAISGVCERCFDGMFGDED